MAPAFEDTMLIDLVRAMRRDRRGNKQTNNNKAQMTKLGDLADEDEDE